MANANKKDSALDIFNRLSGISSSEPPNEDASTKAEETQAPVSPKPAEVTKAKPKSKKDETKNDKGPLRSYFIEQEILDAMALKRSLDHGKRTYSDYVCEALRQYLSKELQMVKNR